MVVLINELLVGVHGRTKPTVSEYRSRNNE